MQTMQNIFVLPKIFVDFFLGNKSSYKTKQ